MSIQAFHCRHLIFNCFVLSLCRFRNVLNKVPEQMLNVYKYECLIRILYRGIARIYLWVLRMVSICACNPVVTILSNVRIWATFSPFSTRHFWWSTSNPWQFFNISVYSWQCPAELPSKSAKITWKRNSSRIFRNMQQNVLMCLLKYVQINLFFVKKFTGQDKLS